MFFNNVTNLQFWNSDGTEIKVTHEGGTSETIVKEGRIGWLGALDLESPISDYVAPAMTWNEVRAERNQLLAETDFHALADVTMSDEMIAYRQALRDVPADNADPDDISWPTKP